MKTGKQTNHVEKSVRPDLFRKGLSIDAAAYLLGFGIGIVPFILVDDLFAAEALFTLSATAVIYIFTLIFSDVSIYDPYWSVAPPVMVAAAMIKYRLWNVNSAIILLLVLIWSVRLTGNWLATYKGLGCEDWRYRMYREKLPPVLFQLLSFFGLQLMPTVVVYLGLVSGFFSIRRSIFAPLSVIGIAVMAGAVVLEFVSDRAIHRFLREHKGENRTCDISVWQYSRHPNYLGEMSFWTGMYLYFLALCPEKWYMGLGFLGIIAVFLTVSIPMMEKHNSERRKDYEEYKQKTSMLLLLPPKKQGNKKAKAIFISAIILVVAAAGVLAALFYFGVLHFNCPDRNTYPVRGVDVSRYQGEVDWQTLSEEGIAFAFIKATEGSAYVDPNFEANWADASGTGLRIGAYHFFSFESSGLKQAENFRNAVKRVDGMLPPVIDVEYYGAFRSVKDIDADQIKKELRDLVDELTSEYGMRPVIYVDQASYETIVKGGFDDCDLWYRSVYSPVPEAADWTFWQYSNRHVLKGYAGQERYVDMNVFNGTAEEFGAYPDE